MQGQWQPGPAGAATHVQQDIAGLDESCQYLHAGVEGSAGIGSKTLDVPRVIVAFSHVCLAVNPGPLCPGCVDHGLVIVSGIHWITNRSDPSSTSP